MLGLYLFRHASALRSSAHGDKDRALDASGRAAAAMMGAWLRRQEAQPERALVSDARRTRETFQIACAQTGMTASPRYEPSLYDADEDALLRLLAEFAGSAAVVLMIGHNPGLASLAAGLSGEGDPQTLAQMRQTFPPAAIARLSLPVTSWRQADWGGATLDAFVTPDSLAER